MREAFALRCGLVFGAMSLAAWTGCTVNINHTGGDGWHSNTVGTIWTGTGVKMVPIVPDTYTGQLCVYDTDGSSRPEGYGTYTTSDGEVKEGQFKNGALNGHGVHRYASGWREEGEWKDGKRDGTFSETDARGTHLEIEYREGTQIRGEGTLVYDDKTRQVGKWDDVLGRGTGRIDWPDGRHYEGEWRNMQGKLDVPDGEGVMTWPDGRKYAGGFRDGKPHGAGKMTDANGKATEGVWKNGERVEAAK
jgi:hypothetical protein